VPWERLTPQQREFQAAKMAIHAAMVHRMDLEIGRILEQLRAMNAWSNTLIFFATDNGASAEIMVRGDGHDPTAPMGSANSYLCLGPGFSSACNTPFRRHKSWVHEGGIATPLIVHWPAGIPPSARGSLRRAVTHFIDFVPTVLELAGVERPTTIQGAPVPPLPGQSWVPLITGEDRAWHRVLWWYHEGNRAVRLGDWKLVAGHDSPKPKDPMPGSWELYDLSRDRSETRNLAAEMPDRVRELAALWEQMAEEIRALANRDPLPDTEPGGTSAPPRVRVKSGEKPAAQPASPQQVPTPN
jgi:arylsulfatase